jgi:predicted O-methyltransferase YrrM
MRGIAEAPPLVGTVFAAAHAALDRSSVYHSFRANDAPRAEFCRLVESRAEDLQAAGVPESDVPFMKRFPRNPRAYTTRVLADLHRRGILTTATCDAMRLQQTELMMADYKHGSFKTFIYPEEGLLLAAIADIAKPRHAIFLGSYYGYWANWAIPAIVAAGGKVTLVDPNETCCDIARQNLRANGLAESVELVASRGEPYLATCDETFDLVVLDAENPRDCPDPDQRGKRVYHSLMQACLPRLAPSALLVCHNILFTDASGDSAFAQVIARNREELAPFAELVAGHFAPFVEYRTTEGVGIGRLGDAPENPRWPVAADIDPDAA